MGTKAYIKEISNDIKHSGPITFKFGMQSVLNNGYFGWLESVTLV